MRSSRKHPLQNDGIVGLQEHINFLSGETPRQSKVRPDQVKGQSAWLCTMMGLAQAKTAFCCGPSVGQVKGVRTWGQGPYEQGFLPLLIGYGSSFPIGDPP